MKRQGKVISTSGNRAKISLRKHTACGDCGACHIGDENMEMQIEALNDAKAQVGDNVEIDMATPNVINAAFVAYGIPLLALVLSLVIGNLFLPESYSLIIGIIAMGIAFLYIKSNEKKIKDSPKYVSHVTKILE